MPFDNNTPLAAEKISTSQPKLLSNNVTIESAFNTNHGDLNGAFQGQHKLSMYYNQPSDPATATNQTALYAKNVAGLAHLFLRHANNGPAIDLTNYVSTANAPAGRGYFDLPCGLRVMWTSRTITAGNTGYNGTFTGDGLVAFSNTPVFSQATLVVGTNINALMWVSNIAADAYTVQARRANDVSLNVAFDTSFALLVIGPV